MKRRVITYFKIAFLLTLFALLCVNLSAQQQPSFKVLVVGGADNTGVFANTSEVFDSSTGTWTLSANNIPNAPPNTVGGLCAPNIAKVGNGKILLAGGGCTDFGFTTNAASLYDPTSSIWTATGTSAPNFMNYGRDQFGMVTIKGGNALAFDGCAGGCSGPNILGQFISTVGNSAEVYSYLSNTWTIVNPSLTTRGNLAFNNLNQDAVVLQDGRVLTCNGSDGFQTYNNSCEIYDPVGNNWAVTGSMPEVGDHRLLLLPSGEVLTVLNTGNLAFLFDPNSGTWTTTGSLGIPQIGGNLLLLSDGRVLYSGGTDTQGNPVNTVQIYDPATQQWFAASSMTTSRFDHIAVRLPDGRVLAAGGESSNLVVTASAEIYDPSTGLWTLTGPMNSPRLQAGALLLANPVPLINLPLVPDAVVAGTNGVTLTVNGSGFVANSVVMWNGTALPTTFVNFNQLTATVPASDIAVDGTASVTVTNPGPGGGTSNVVFFTTTTPTTNLSFSSSSISFGSSFPFDMLAADFNNDSKLDLAVTNVGTNAVDILLGNGDGTFQNQLASPTGSSPYGVAVGDFNGDGKLDLAAANVFGNSVSILLGNGDGTFQNQVAYATGLDPYGVAVGDFNGDGELDLAVPNYFGNSVSILLGNGNGTFQNQVAYATGSNPIGITLGDFNGDGKLDLVVTNSSAGTVSILLGNGDGTFQNQVVYTTAGTPHGVTVGDFNGDGKLDLATANVFGNSVSILLGNGDGTFQNQATYATGTEPEKVATGDFNGDGKLDLAVTNYFDNTISILLGNGDGTFQNQIVYATGLNPEGITVGDFNGDGRLDLVVANYQNNSVSILMQSPNISISPPSVNFGPQQVGTTSGPQTLTVTNTGTATLTISSITIGGLNAGDFAETDNCIGNSVAQTQSCTVQVTFTPTATGLLSANLSFTDNAPGSPQTVPLSGTGTSPGPVIISPPSLTFGSQLVNTTSTPQTLLVTNSGTAALTISAIATTGDFSQTNNCGTSLAPSASCNIQVAFTPTAVGVRSGTLCITDNALGSPQCVPLSGTGTSPGPVIISPTSLTFGSQLVNTTSTPQTLLVTNSGTAALTISAIATTGDFSQTNNCGTSLAPSASCNIQVAFTPTGVGVRTGTLSITDNALGSPQTVLLSGAGIAPGPSCAPLVQSTSTLFTISVSANCSDLSGTITSITIDWGDGSQLTSGSSGTHTYSAAGTYTVTVTATDNFMLVGSNSVSAILTAPPPPGTAGQVTTVTFSAPTGAPASTFSCTSAIGPGGQLILDLSTVGISCTFSSPPGTPTEIDLAINTTGGTIAALHRPHVSTFSTSLAFWMPLPAIVILGSGVLGVRSRRKAFGRYLTIGLLVVFLATLSSCGGGFTLRQPQSLTTPPGTYYITSVGGSTDPVTGFRQVSLIVPLTVTGH